VVFGGGQGGEKKRGEVETPTMRGTERWVGGGKGERGFGRWGIGTTVSSVMLELKGKRQRNGVLWNGKLDRFITGLCDCEQEDGLFQHGSKGRKKASSNLHGGGKFFSKDPEIGGKERGSALGGFG